jgi:Cu/Ag efflux protein CusF
MPRKLNSFPPRIGLLFLCALLAACNHGPSQPAATNSSTAAKRYSLKGKVVSVDKQAQKANIENEPIAGLMDSMVMSYTVQPPATLDQLQPGDSIAADVVVEPDKYWLENVQVAGHASPPAGKPASSAEKDQKDRRSE